MKTAIGSSLIYSLNALPKERVKSFPLSSTLISHKAPQVKTKLNIGDGLFVSFEIGTLFL